MSSPERPTFSITAGTTSPAERRLVTVGTVRALTGLSAGDFPDETLELFIDDALAQCATWCRLARAGVAPPTFAQEAVRATWLDRAAQPVWPHGLVTYRGSQLLLPWRVPISDIAVTEGETELEKDTDYRLLGAGVLERMSSGAICGWGTGTIVVDYVAGWAVPSGDASAEPDGESMPPDLVARVVDQVKLACLQRDQDTTLRSEDIPNIWSGSYNVIGGDAIGSSGLLRSLEAALGPWRSPSVFA